LKKKSLLVLPPLFYEENESFYRRIRKKWVQISCRNDLEDPKPNLNGITKLPLKSFCSCLISAATINWLLPSTSTALTYWNLWLNAEKSRIKFWVVISRFNFTALLGLFSLLLVVNENVLLRACVHRHMLSLIFSYATKALLTSYDLKHLLRYTVACRVIKVSLLLLLLVGWQWRCL